ncbi:uncharacterized protein BYT42DRAFT_541833 [Radiomyces spectabilis]|uniref:uncharacterized protein n=1 Tax=Radiomyces spectabilis TaxID=64574 RepID=UPI002221288F|nr:uncharacterized protein BYT42DRAFT_541833 [Radiomyces spectabilis]KAI8393594.1 hypothetical protein BYT42DRAFT_541833 [Radiomyces spectabilis]
MANTDVDNVLKDVGDLDNVLFQKPQQRLQHELGAFVQAFDDNCHSKINPETLASHYVQLVQSVQQLEQAKQCHFDFEEISNQASTTKERLAALQDIITQTEHSPETDELDVQRQEFLKMLEQKQKKDLQRWQMEKDKLEEYYTKKTRESTYRNLVGSNAWS